MARVIASSSALSAREIIRVRWASLVVLLFALPLFGMKILSASGIDAAWIAALHHAFAQHWRFGHDIVWHYGPLGFLFGGFHHPETYGWMIAFYAVFLGVFWAGMMVVWREAPRNPAAQIAASLLIVMTEDVLFFALPMLLILLQAFVPQARSKAVFWLVLAACALGGWVKFSYLLAGFAAVAAIELHGLQTRRACGRVMLAFVALLLGFWLVLGQQLGDVLPYLRGAWELGRGFGAIATNVHPAFYAALFVALSASWIFALSHTLRQWVLGGGLMLQLLLVMKAEFLNDNDHHLIQALGWFFLLALLTKDFFWTQRARFVTAPLLLSAVVSALLVVPGYVQKSGPELMGWVKVAQELRAPSTSHAAAKPREMPVAQAGGTDVYTQSLMVLLGQAGAEYRPRPVLQSYHAYTSYLARLNRDALRGENAAQHVWFKPEGFAGIYPAMLDGLSWPELLTRYDLQTMRGDYAVLQRAARAREYRLVRLGEAQHVRFDETIEVPRAGMVWATLQVEPTLLGKLTGLVYRLPPVSMQVDGDVFHLMPEVAQEGFFLSPRVESTNDFAALFGAQNHSQPMVKTMTLQRPKGAGWLFENVVAVQFYRLEIMPVPARSGK